LAAEIKKAFGTAGVDVQLVKGSGGIFDVYDGEARVFSKHETLRFPEADELIAKLGK
jgi:predicted Rdx family selenoprotein